MWVGMRCRYHVGCSQHLDLAQAGGGFIRFQGPGPSLKARTAPVLPRLATISTLTPVAAENSAPTCCSIPIALPVPPTRNVSAAAAVPVGTAPARRRTIADFAIAARMMTIPTTTVG